MSRIISVSRRTDIPAFYPEWFEQRLKEGFAGWENPFGGQRYLVSLQREDVLAFAFWSKNYRPFLPTIKRLKSLNYPMLFNYTITGLPKIFECNLVSTEDSINSLKELAKLCSPKHISWRYDPIIISSKTTPEYHLKRFNDLCIMLKGYVKRCYFSYAIMYGKVENNFHRFESEYNIKVIDLPISDKIDLAKQLADIAALYGIEMFTCCGDYLINEKIKKARCVDGDIISELYYDGDWKGIGKPTRKECGCTESTDIGKYNTCPHGCIYCYANINKDEAKKVYDTHETSSAFLGSSEAESVKLMQGLKIIKSKCKKLKSDDKGHEYQQQLWSDD